MTRYHASFATFSLMVLLAGCGDDPSPPDAPERGPVARMIDAAASRNGVPTELMTAIAIVEGGVRLPPVRIVHDDELIPIAGALELRHGRFDTLARGAELMGSTERELEIDRALGTEAGARVLDDLARSRGIERSDLAAWASIVEQLSGHASKRDQVDYRVRVFRLLRDGGVVRGHGGEVITTLPRGDVPFHLTVAPPALEVLGTPEYTGAIWFDTPACVAGGCKYNDYRNAAVSMIAIHDTEGGWDASVSTLQNDPGKSVHYIVDADGSRVGQFIPEAYTAWQVGNSYYNHRMVGIEHVGYAGEDDYQTAMYETSADLVKSIAARHDLALSRKVVVAHQEVPDGVNTAKDSKPCSQSPGDCIASGKYGGAGHHHDPGTNWEWCQYMNIVGGECKCNDAFPLWNCVHDLSMMARCNDGAVELTDCPAGCLVEADGIDDHCAEPRPPTGEGGSDESASVAAGVGGHGASDAGAGGTLSEPLSDAPGGDVDGSCGCTVPGGSAPENGALVFAGLAVCVACLRRRRAGGTAIGRRAA